MRVKEYIPFTGLALQPTEIMIQPPCNPEKRGIIRKRGWKQARKRKGN